MSAFVIARLTFREASRRWILWMALLLGVLFLAVYAIGFNEIHKDILRRAGQVALLERSEFYNFMVMAGLYVVNFLTVIMAVLTSVDTLSGEIASGTIHTLVSKPLQRWEIVLGKWLGFAAMLLLYLVLMAGGVSGERLPAGWLSAIQCLAGSGPDGFQRAALVERVPDGRRSALDPGKRRSGIWTVRAGIHRGVDRADSAHCCRTRLPSTSASCAA